VSAAAQIVPPADPALDAIAAKAWTLEPPMPHEIPSILRPEAAELVDGLLVRVARGRGALDVALGEGLAALMEGDRAMRLGYSGIGDYARERLGIARSTGYGLAKLWRALRGRPLLREAVRRGEVSARKAQTILPVARGDAEAEWVGRARKETVRALAQAVREAGAAGEGEGEGEVEDPRWERITVQLSPAARARVDEAMELAGRLLGAASPRWERLEAICAEYLGGHPIDPAEAPGSGLPFRGPVSGWLEAARAGMEAERKGWTYLMEPDAVEGDVSRIEAANGDPLLVDAELRRLAAMRDRWDELLGHLAMLMRMVGLWRDAGFADFGQYCTERLELAESTVAQRIAVTRKFYELPGLRTAVRGRAISYEKARLLARVATAETLGQWIARAERTTCIALAREIEAAEQVQMCGRGDLDLRVPARVADLVSTAIVAARKAEKRWLTPGEALERIADHFIATWKEALKERSTPRTRALRRDRGLCLVPGCSRTAVHAHHVLHRARGGGDDERNLAGLCAGHHLVGVHGGWIRVHGQAPDRLVWEMAAPPWGVEASR
jgi:hypothetical protein